jgi:hypothetical protein
MKRCQSAEQCYREATLTARLFRVGDRSLCQPCFDTYVRLGMDVRELDAAVVPAWRQRSLARDNTGRVMGLLGGRA